MVANSQVKFEIIRHIAILSIEKSGWTKEINIISYNNAQPKHDICTWDPNHEKMCKGITLTKEELTQLEFVFKESL